VEIDDLPTEALPLSSEQFRMLYDYIEHPSNPSLDRILYQFSHEEKMKWENKAVVTISQEIPDDTKRIERERVRHYYLSKAQLNTLNQSKVKFQYMKGADPLTWSALVDIKVTDPNLIAFIEHGTDSHEGQEIQNIMSVKCFREFFNEQQDGIEQKTKERKIESDNSGSSSSSSGSDSDDNDDDDYDGKESKEEEEEDDDDDDDDDDNDEEEEEEPKISTSKSESSRPPSKRNPSSARVIARAGGSDDDDEAVSTGVGGVGK
jgi:hypothetical protein